MLNLPDVALDNCMRCSLLIPNLFWPVTQGEDPYRELSLPALETLFARGTHESSPEDGVEAWLCRAFGVKKQLDWPVAPLTLVADGGHAGREYWLRADPVHLRLEREQLILGDSGTFSISQAEADMLTDVLNRHFAQDGLIFYPLHPARWYLRPAEPPALHTHPVTSVAGKNINEYLPTGADCLRWHSLFNEVQMLFHEHPVNQERENRGEPVVNSIWLWGGGTMPAVGAKPFGKIWGGGHFARSLAQAGAISWSERPREAMEWREQADAAGAHLVILDDLRAAAEFGDAYGWREELKQMEQNWFAQILGALKQGSVSDLRIIATYGQNAVSFDVTARDMWKLWRRPRPLPSYVQAG